MICQVGLPPIRNLEKTDKVMYKSYLISEVS